MELMTFVIKSQFIRCTLQNQWVCNRSIIIRSPQMCNTKCLKIDSMRSKVDRDIGEKGASCLREGDNLSSP